MYEFVASPSRAAGQSGQLPHLVTNALTGKLGGPSSPLWGTCYSLYTIGPCELWWIVQASNLLPPACKAGALPNELTTHIKMLEEFFGTWANPLIPAKPYCPLSAPMHLKQAGTALIHFFVRLPEAFGCQRCVST